MTAPRSSGRHFHLIEDAEMDSYRKYHTGPWAHQIRSADRQRRRMRRIGWGLVFLGLAVLAHVALAAPSKTRASVALHHQIAEAAK